MGTTAGAKSEILQFETHHPVGSRARLALALGLCTGQRKGDVIKMGWQHIEGERIVVRQQKTNTALTIPLILPELKTALASVPRTNMTFLVTEQGAPFTSAGFGNWWRDRCNEAGLPHCSFHGLRKACATRLANADCTNEQIRAITGHRSAKEVEPYIRARDQKLLAEQALNKLLRADGEQKFVQPQARLDKNAK